MSWPDAAALHSFPEHFMPFTSLKLTHLCWRDCLRKVFREYRRQLQSLRVGRGGIYPRLAATGRHLSIAIVQQ